MQQAHDLAIDVGHPGGVIRRLHEMAEATADLVLGKFIAELAQQGGHGGQISWRKVANDHCAFVLPGPRAAKVGAADTA